VVASKKSKSEKINKTLTNKKERPRTVLQDFLRPLQKNRSYILFVIVVARFIFFELRLQR
jgi:hypothetical protein